MIVAEQLDTFRQIVKSMKSDRFPIIIAMSN